MYSSLIKMEVHVDFYPFEDSRDNSIFLELTQLANRLNVILYVPVALGAIQVYPDDTPYDVENAYREERFNV